MKVANLLLLFRRLQSLLFFITFVVTFCKAAWQLFSRTSRWEIVGFSEFLAGALGAPRADERILGGAPGVQDGRLLVLAALRSRCSMASCREVFALFIGSSSVFSFFCCLCVFVLLGFAGLVSLGVCFWCSLGPWWILVYFLMYIGALQLCFSFVIAIVFSNLKLLFNVRVLDKPGYHQSLLWHIWIDLVPSVEIQNNNRIQ